MKAYSTTILRVHNTQGSTKMLSLWNIIFSNWEIHLKLITKTTTVHYMPISYPME
jgi:hypothetical protein